MRRNEGNRETVPLVLGNMKYVGRVDSAVKGAKSSLGGIVNV